MRAAGFEVLNDVVLNQVLVAFGESSRTEAIIAAVQDEGTCWCGPTSWQGRSAMRVSVSCWNTTPDDVAAVRACARAAVLSPGNSRGRIGDVEVLLHPG
jgi:hypothetical protein